MIEYDPYAKIMRQQGEYFAITEYERKAILYSNRNFTDLSRIELLLDMFENETEQEYNTILEDFF